MPPGRRPTHSSAEFVSAGIAFADEHGIETLTLRALGSALGISTTAIYRYFPDKRALLSAMRDTLMDGVLREDLLSSDPRGTIRDIARAFRRTANAHPCLGPLMTLTGLRGPGADRVPAIVGTALHDLGLRDRELVVAYRQVETFVAGSCVFDLAGAPAHLTDRLDRLQGVDRPEFRAILVNPAAVEAVNEAAFEASLEALLDSLSTHTHRST